MERGAFKLLLSRINEAEEDVDQWGMPLSYGGNTPAPRIKESDLVTVTSKQGFSAKVHKTVAPQFQKLINYMDEPAANGKPRYEIKSMEGYYNRWIMRNDPETGKRIPLVRDGKYVPSNHGLGATMDFNPDDNPESFSGKVKTDIPQDVIDKAYELGLGNGANWTANHKDPMHFSAISKEGGKLTWNSKTRDFDLSPTAVAKRDEKKQGDKGPSDIASLEKEISKDTATGDKNIVAATDIPPAAKTDTDNTKPTADVSRIKQLAGISDEQAKLSQLLQANPGMKISTVIHPGNIINLPDGSKYKVGPNDNLTWISQGKYKGEIVAPPPVTVAVPADAGKAAVPVIVVPTADVRQAAGTPQQSLDAVEPKSAAGAPSEPYNPLTAPASTLKMPFRKVDVPLPKDVPAKVTVLPTADVKLDPMGRPYPEGANDYQKSVIDALASKGVTTNDLGLIATEPGPEFGPPKIPDAVPYDVLKQQFDRAKIQGAGGGVVSNPNVSGVYDPSKYAKPEPTVIDRILNPDTYKGAADAVQPAIKSFKDYLGSLANSEGPFQYLNVPTKEGVQKTNEYGAAMPPDDGTDRSTRSIIYPPISKPDEIGDLINRLDKMDAQKNIGPTTPFDPTPAGPAQKFEPNPKLPQPGQFLKQDDAKSREPINEKEITVRDSNDQDGDGDEDFADVMIARRVASGEPKKKAIAATGNKPYNEVDMNESLMQDSLALIKKFAGI